MQPLAGQVGIVTGASSGIGAAVARRLAADGMHVVAAARRRERLEQLCGEINAGGGEATPAALDLRDEAGVDALIDTAAAIRGRLDLLVNNAAIGTVRPIAAGITEEWRAIFDTNVIGTLIACRAALRHMLPAGAGTIVNLTSASAYEAWPYLSVYAGSKAAVHSLSRGLRAEVAARGVRVMTLEVHNVGATDFAVNFEPEMLAEALQRWTEIGLLTRDSAMIAADDVARAIAFMVAQPDPVSVHHLAIRSRAN